jgi:hypothetical protein
LRAAVASTGALPTTEKVMSPEQPKLFQFDQQMLLFSTVTLFFQQFQINQSNTVSRLSITIFYDGSTCIS